MLNYLKSEFYRVARSRDLYILTIVAAMLTVFMNAVLYYFQHFVTGEFRYATVRFSLNNMLGNLTFMFVGGLIAAVLVFADEHKNGTIKNTVAYGVSRTQFFIGKCIVASVTASISFIVIEAAHIGTAYLLLENAELEPLKVLLHGVAAILPAAFGAIVLGIAVLCCTEKLTNVIIIWTTVFYLIPAFCDALGRKSELFAKIVRWMPNYQFGRGITGYLGTYQCVWDTPEGLFRCLVSGFAILLMSAVAGILIFRRKAIR